MSAMMSLLVIAPWGLDAGFKLGGAMVKTAADRETLNAELEAAIGKKDVGVIALPDTMRDWVAEKHRRVLKKNLFPLLAFYHMPGDMAQEPAEAVEELVRQAIGYRLRIKL